MPPGEREAGGIFRLAVEPETQFLARSYEAGPLDQSILTFAHSVLNSVMAFHTPAPSVVPTHGGGLQLEWHLGGCEIELMIYRPYEAELSATFADGRDPIEDEPLSTDFDALGTALSAIS